MRIPCEPLNMKISVMNKNTAVRKSFSATSGSKVIISIRTPGDEKAEFDDENKSIKDVLYLAFYDVSFENSDIYAGYAGMTAEDALERDRVVLDSVKRTLQCWAIDPELGDPDAVDIWFCGPGGGDLTLSGTEVTISSTEPYEGLPSS